MERKNWPRRKKLEEKELKVLDVEEKPAIAIAIAPLNQDPVSGWARVQGEAEIERLRDENALLFASLQNVSEANRRAQLELRAMRNKLQASDKDKSRLQYELHLLNKQLQIRSQEKESSTTGEVEEECELFRGLIGKKGYSRGQSTVWTKGVGSPDDDNEDDISCAESWASALLSELDHFKPKQSQDFSVVTEILELIHPIALHLQMDTGRLIQAKEKVGSLQDQALLHFVQELSSLLTSILSPGNGFYSDPTRETKLQLEIDKLHGQIEDLNKELQSQINQRQHLSDLNEKLDKDIEAYKREKDACNINQCHKEEQVTEDSKKLAECRRTIEDLGKQVSAVAGYEEKERCPWAEEEEEEEEEKPTLRRVSLFRRLFLCASPKQRTPSSK